MLFQGFILTTILILFPLLVAAWNGYVIVWGLSNDAASREKANVIWHRIGWFIRALPALWLIADYWGYWFMLAAILSLYLFLGHAVYNTIINIIRGKPWDYIGTSQGGTVSWIDMLFKSKKIYRLTVAGELLLVIVTWLLL